MPEQHDDRGDEPTRGGAVGRLASRVTKNTRPGAERVRRRLAGLRGSGTDDNEPGHSPAPDSVSEGTAQADEGWVHHEAGPDGEGFSGWLYHYADGTMAAEDGTVYEYSTSGEVVGSAAGSEPGAEPEPEPEPERGFDKLNHREEEPEPEPEPERGFDKLNHREEEPDSDIPRFVEYSPSPVRSYVLGAVFAAAAIGAALTALLAMEDPSGEKFVLPAVLAVLALGARWLLISWRPTVVSIEDGVLEVARGGEEDRFDLRDPATGVELGEKPGPSWKAVVTGPEGARTVVRAHEVKPRQFSRIVEHHRRNQRGAGQPED